MTEAKNRLAVEILTKQMPQEKRASLTKLLNKYPDDCFEPIMALPLKKTWITLVLSIFLGAIGADRYYLGDSALGTFKLVGTLVGALLRVIIGPSIIVGLVNTINIIWKVVDIFVSYKTGQTHNYNSLIELLHGKEIPATAAEDNK